MQLKSFNPSSKTRSMLSKNRHINPHKSYFAILLLSLLLFLWKGINYASLGSWLPLQVAGGVLALLLGPMLLFRNTPKWPVRIWGVLLIIWGLGRIIIGVLLSFSPEVTEAHIRYQLGGFGITISILAILTGRYLFVEAREIFSS